MNPRTTLICWLLGVAAVSPASSYAQLFCTVQSFDPDVRNFQNCPEGGSCYSHTNETAVVRTYVHYVGSIDTQAFLSKWAAAAEVFASLGIVFEIASFETLPDQFIPNCTGTTPLPPNYNEDGLDVYVNSSSGGAGCGLQLETWMNIGTESTLNEYIHELGHVFVLHHSNEGPPCQGSDCWGCGDHICDNSYESCVLDGPTCEWILGPCVTTQLEIDYMSTMGGTNECGVRFTPQQIDRMFAAIEHFPELTQILIDPPQFTESSGTTGISLTGIEPYASIEVDIGEDANGDRDLILSVFDDSLRPYANTGSMGDVSTFSNIGNAVFGIDEVPFSTRGISVADYDNDNDLDLFVAGGTAGATLYRNDGGSPLLVDSGLLSGATVSDSWAGSWGDYDGDGDVDLYVVRSRATSPTVANFDASAGEVDLLLENDVCGNAGFNDVTSSAGLSTDASKTIAATWGDIDGDRDLDLYVSWLGTANPTSSSLAWSPLYENVSGTFSDRTFQNPAPESAPKAGREGFVSGSKLEDLDGDGFPELLLARQESGASAENLRVLGNLGSGDLTGPGPPGLASSIGIQGIEVQDVDGNGTLDVLTAPVGQDELELFLGYITPSGVGFVNRAQDSGVVGGALTVGQVRGLAVGDFNDDFDMDVFLGRSDDFYFANDPGSLNNSVKVQLIGDGDIANTLALGTRVKLVSTDAHGKQLTQYRWIDGGSGRGGQSPNILTFGIGTATQATMTATWLDGVQQTGSVSAGATLTKKRGHAMTILGGTVTASFTVDGSGYTLHTYSWQTSERSDEVTGDQVVFPGKHPTGACDIFPGPGDPEDLPFTLKSGMTGVTVTQVQLDCGAWKHTVTWVAPCVAPCTYKYKVRSRFLGAPWVESATKQLTIPICSEIQE